MTLRFTEDGKFISSLPEPRLIASTGYSTVDSPTETLAASPFDFVVDLGITKGYWGQSTPKKGIQIDAKEVAVNVAAFARAFPNVFSLEDSLMDGLSSVSVHELIHQVGKVTHIDKWHRKAPRKIDEFYALEAVMGHPIKSKMRQALKGTLDVQHEIMAIDLPEDGPELPTSPTPLSPSPPAPTRPAFETCTIGNMVLKVRRD